MGCGASAQARYVAKGGTTHSPADLREAPCSYRGDKAKKVSGGALSSLASTADSTHLESTAPCLEATPQDLQRAQSPRWEVQDVDGTPVAESGRKVQLPVTTGPGEPEPAPCLSAGWDWSDQSSWWGQRTDWIQQRAKEIVSAYNCFFEHIGLRKGWRTAPFLYGEVQRPFRAAAEVVVVVRARLDSERGCAMVLRQVEGAAMNFLWGWDPSRPPGSSLEALADFFKGLAFATLSDGKGLVEGLDSSTVESYVGSHPLLTSHGTLAAVEELEGCAPEVPGQADAAFEAGSQPP